MTATKIDRPLPIAGLALGLALSFFGGASLAGPGTQTEDDVYVGNKRQAEGVNTPMATTPKPPRPGAGTSPNTARSNASVSSEVRPTVRTLLPMPPREPAAAPQPRPGAGVSPNTGAAAAKKTARAGGDDDLDDLEGERRKVQGVTAPGTATPQRRPGAGTSPNPGRSAGPVPAVLPGKPL